MSDPARGEGARRRIALHEARHVAAAVVLGFDVERAVIGADDEGRVYGLTTTCDRSGSNGLGRSVDVITWTVAPDVCERLEERLGGEPRTGYVADEPSVACAAARAISPEELALIGDVPTDTWQAREVALEASGGHPKGAVLLVELAEHRAERMALEDERFSAIVRHLTPLLVRHGELTEPQLRAESQRAVLALDWREEAA